jgi:hypothetical protein
MVEQKTSSAVIAAYLRLAMQDLSDAVALQSMVLAEMRQTYYFSLQKRL